MTNFLFAILRKITIWLPWPTYWRDLLMWPITSRILPKDYSAVIKRPGYLLRVDLKDQLNRMLLFYGSTVKYVWEPQTTKVAQLIIENAQISLVAGSHIGIVNLELLTSLKPNATIYTFEPAKYLFDRSIENIALNNCQNRVKIQRAGLAESVGEITFYIEDLRSSAIPYSPAHTKNNNVEKVATVTVDSFKATSHIPKIDFIFLDVEGLENAVFIGAEDTIKKDKPTIIFEVSPKILAVSGVTSAELYGRLTNTGYELYGIEDNYELKDVASWDSRDIKLVPIDNYTIKSSYCNILAVPKENQTIHTIIKNFL